MHRSIPFLIAFLASSLPLQAQDKGWEMFDPSKQGQTSQKSDAQAVYENLLKLIDTWNSRDIDGYLDLYWKSPELLVVADMEQLDGWQNLHDFLMKSFRDPNLMGHGVPARVQVEIFASDMAYGLVWLEFDFPGSGKKLQEVRTIVLRKFGEGWKIIASQVCGAELP